MRSPRKEQNMNNEAVAPRRPTAQRLQPCRMTDMTWTDARIALLEKLWRDGVSASGVAEALGEVSRSAVLGKLHRLKLLKSRQAASPPRRYQAAGPAAALAREPSASQAVLGRSAPPEPPRSPWNSAAFRPRPGGAEKPWLAREAHECAFPVDGDGEATVSCCAPIQPRSRLRAIVAMR